MPIYEYACPDCGHQFEHIQKLSDSLLSECPACGKEGLRKLVSATSFQLKGSGWYRDHYGLKSGGQSADSGSESNPDATSSGSSEPASGGGTESASSSGTPSASDGNGGESS